MFSEDGHLVWAAHYRTWGAVKHIWQADNDNEAYHAPNPSPAFLMRGSLAIRYDRVAEQRAHEAALNCPIRFQGQWEDAESGLYYNHHRYYDPLIASYLSPDPIGLAGGLRPNGYVHNPNVWIDPLGLKKKKKKDCCTSYPEDYEDKHTVRKSSLYNSERDARNFARQKLGKDPVKIERGKWRSQDGKWQYRAKPNDLTGHGSNDTPHIHLERLDPNTGRVIENNHLRWQK